MLSLGNMVSTLPLMCALVYQPRANVKEQAITVRYDKLPDFARTRLEFADPLLIVGVMSCPLATFQPKAVDVIGYHAFVVMKSEHWWWSIDRHFSCVTIQCSSSFEGVVRNLKGVPRKTTKIMYQATAKSGSMVDVINFLHVKRLFAPYDLLFFNCKNVAEAVYNHFRAQEFPEQYIF